MRKRSYPEGFAPSRGHARRLQINFAPSWYKVGHLMDIYDVSHSTLYRWIANGLVPQPDKRVNGRPRWDPAKIHEHCGKLPVSLGGAGAALVAVIQDLGRVGGL